MRAKEGFTLIELLVVIAIMTILIALLLPTLHMIREQGKRAICMGNLKELNIAWVLYANDHDQKLISGNAGATDLQGPVTGWIGKAYDNPGYLTGKQLPEKQQKEGIRAGTLWPYAEDESLYKCPTGLKGALVTYAIMDAMNGCTGRRDEGSPFVDNMMQINQPSERMVFIDEGRLTPDSFAVYYVRKVWWDSPPVRHRDGTTFSYADGSVRYYKWQGSDTIMIGKDALQSHINGISPATSDGFLDLQFIQKGCWGKLGYDPLK